MSAEVVKNKEPRKRKPKAYKLPDRISPGEILTDMTKKQWILGESVGIGGFGEVYSAAPYNGKAPNDYPNVIKIEPHENGPLYVEMQFYMRNGKANDIDAWAKKKKLSGLGMPPYLGSGSHEYKNTKYRFVVTERYGIDLWKLFEQNNRRFPEHTVYKVALQILNVLEYIHSKTYVHGDIKGSNLMLHPKSPDQVYLVDFGLACRYTTKNEYKLDPKRAHNGTTEYNSRDAHTGVPTMRGDLEILGYNMIQWLCGSLLWEKDISDPAAVHKQKEKAFENIPGFLKHTFHGTVPKSILRYMTRLASMKFNDVPDYEEFKKTLTDGLKQLSHKPEGKLEFKNSVHHNHTQAVLKPVTPLDVKVPTVNRTGKSPRIGALKNPRRRKVPSPVRSLDDSTVGIVIDKKRAGMKDIQKVLNDMESDGEYDIKIVRKAKKVPKPIPAHIPTAVQGVVVKNRRRNNVNYHEVSSDSEPEIRNKNRK
ncbi:serine/threonine-protein kinase VRK1 [Lasioglossum baleicum]|uniref:serine/threonine-protein kinase VRK1 n=1 Tax=Lasioglossum baleicum TaxID=434251 RepID=UPI003FCE2BD1